MIKRKISLQNRSIQGERAWDLILSLSSTCRKLDLSFWRYLEDRISKEKRFPTSVSSLNHFDENRILSSYGSEQLIRRRPSKNYKLTHSKLRTIVILGCVVWSVGLGDVMITGRTSRDIPNNLKQKKFENFLNPKGFLGASIGNSSQKAARLNDKYL